MSRINSSMYSSDKMDWETPQELFDKLNDEFHFALDAAADQNNFKVFPFLTVNDDSLNCDWLNPTWCNPPYGRNIDRWVRKGYEESLRGVTSVFLLFARTDTKWFHDYVYGKAEIRFLRGRVRFVGADNPAPFPSMIVIYRGVDMRNENDQAV